MGEPERLERGRLFDEVPELPDPPDSERDGGRTIGRYVPATIVGPLIGASLGIDGGPIFQILAVEDLGLSPSAIGIAFGLGVTSLPLQLYASRIPIDRARANVQIFLALAAVQAWILAGLLAVGATGGLAATALAVTVAAEISLSVLFVTAWQPLLSVGVDARGRQRLNSTWAAVARAVLAGAVVLFATLDTAGRSVFLAAIGILAVTTAVGLRHIDRPTPVRSDPGKEATSLTPATRVMLLVFGAVNVGALPLWLVYVDQVLWPDANLGAIAAVQTVAAMVALLGWRPTHGAVVHRALVAAVVGLATAGGLAALDAPVIDTAPRVGVVAATAVLAASTTIVRIAMLESAHRVVRPNNTVKAFTMLDVVASTSLQAGLLLSGFLITASIDVSARIDPYRAFVLVSAALTVPAVLWFKKIAPPHHPPHAPRS